MAILDGGLVPAGRLAGIAAALARGGVRVFQVRWKTASDRAILSVVHALRRSVPRCVVLVNDRCDLAVAAGADGAHLGADDLPAAVARRLLGPRRLLGLSAGTPAEMRAAVSARPDYVSVGPAFRTVTKGDAGPPLGPAGVRRLRRLAPRGLPVLAVGGINSHNGGSLVAAGAAAVAVASWLSKGPRGRSERAARDLIAAVRTARNASTLQRRR